MNTAISEWRRWKWALLFHWFWVCQFHSGDSYWETHGLCSLERSVLCHGQQTEHLCREYQTCEIIIIPSCLNFRWKWEIYIYIYLYMSKNWPNTDGSSLVEKMTYSCFCCGVADGHHLFVSSFQQQELCLNLLTCHLIARRECFGQLTHIVL